MSLELAAIATLTAAVVALLFALNDAQRTAARWKREHDLLDAYFTQYRQNSIRRDRRTGRYIKED
jgi:hypothetical protein